MSALEVSSRSVKDFSLGEQRENTLVDNNAQHSVNYDAVSVRDAAQQTINDVETLKRPLFLWIDNLLHYHQLFISKAISPRE